MTSQLRQYVYLSDAKFGLTGDDIEDILRSARTRNAEDGLTGLLIYCDGNFIQALEGAPDDIDEVMARITNDSRHENISTVSDVAISERTFASWDMAFVEASSHDIRQRSGIEGVLGLQDVMRPRRQ